MVFNVGNYNLKKVGTFNESIKNEKYNMQHESVIKMQIHW